jgi:hypothetical protein
MGHFNKTGPELMQLSLTIDILNNKKLAFE